ncbi:MAG: hypothetical protein FWF88_13810 [Peptococcaceae bacterium]|nr:hypothetical protein [Peptococcaceae bacterium]
MSNILEYETLLRQQTSAEIQLSCINGDITRLQGELADLEQAQADWVLVDEDYTEFLGANTTTNKISQLHGESQWLTGYKIQLDSELDNWEKVGCTNGFDEQTEHINTLIAQKTDQITTQQTNALNTQTKISTLKSQIKTAESENILAPNTLTQNNQWGPKL